MSRPVFRLSPHSPNPDSTIYVDGVEPGYRSLSHWPGNTTPGPFRADLSTEIALLWAEKDPSERIEILGPFDLLANNHYDTDGALSAFAVLSPEEALPRRDLMVRAAATGDFALWCGKDALAVDLSVMHLTKSPKSPLAEQLDGILDDTERWSLGYAWLFEHLPEILDDPFTLKPLWEERFEKIIADISRVEKGEGLTVKPYPESDLAVVTVDAPITTMGLHVAAGDLYRILLVTRAEENNRYRFFYRDESWFDLARPNPPVRLPLTACVENLTALETASDGRWWATELTEPVAMMGFGDPETVGSPFSADPDLSAEPSSDLSEETVTHALLQALVQE